MNLRQIAFLIAALATIPGQALAADVKMVAYHCPEGQQFSVTYTKQQALLSYDRKIIPLLPVPGDKFENGPYLLTRGNKEATLAIEGDPPLTGCKEERHGLDAPPPMPAWPPVK